MGRPEPDHATETHHHAYGTPENLWAKELRVANTAVFDWNDITDDPAWPHGKPAIKLYNTDVIGIQLAFDHINRELGNHHAGDRAGTALIIATATPPPRHCCVLHDAGDRPYHRRRTTSR